MVVRTEYLERIRPFFDQKLVKVIVGVRRCGKSVLLQQICDELLANGAEQNDITLINFESFDNKGLRDPEVLHAHLKERMAGKKKHYVLLDEVQLVDGFQDVVNSLQAEGNASVFITGSNSKLLAGEMATLLSGRYVSFQVMPFSFREYMQYVNDDDSPVPSKKRYPHTYPYTYGLSKDDLLSRYLQWGGFPLVCEQPNEEAKEVVIDDLYTSIVLRDIMDRNSVGKGAPLQNVLDFLIANSSNLVNGKKIADTLTSNGMKVSTGKVYEYLDYIEDAFIVSFAERYDIAGKGALKYEKKAYVCDLGLFHAKKNRTKGEFSYIVETVVYNELISRGYKVYVGKTRKGEIDFVVMQGSKRCYIQVAYLMQDEATMEREFGAFDHVDDSYPKYVVSMDPITQDLKGIKHVRLIEFLEDPSLLRLG